MAKGLDFPDVEVVGILAADMTLHLPDYMSAERTFRLITQAAGRAGRKGAGRVVVQTYKPEHYAVRYALDHDYDGFYRHEQDIRKVFKYPPWTGLLKIMVTGEEEDRVQAACTQLAQKLTDGIAGDISLAAHFVECGAYTAPMTKLSDKYRYQGTVQVYPRRRDGGRLPPDRPGAP